MVKKDKRFFLYVIVVLVFLNLIMLFVPQKKEGLTFTAHVVISSGTIPAGGSLYSCLVEEGLANNQIYEIECSLKKFINPQKCYPGEKYEVIRSTSNELTGFKYYKGVDIYGVEKSTSKGWIARKDKIPLTKEIVGIEGTITTSLWEAMREQSLPPELILNFADIFAWQVDFLTEPREGDTYRLVWERYVGEENDIEVQGKILAARYDGKESGDHFGLRFNNDYYDMKGRSLRKFFLRAPLDYRRISSYFSYKRFHPILKYYRPHLGIDYAAPKGTPVVSIGDGKVIYRGWKGDSGNLVIIRHNSVYTSSYGHLSRYEQGIKKGVYVKQGQVIAYVGQTGLATGPHLDFRFKKRGKFKNFLRLKLPPVKSVSKNTRQAFTEVKQERLTQLAFLSVNKNKSTSFIVLSNISTRTEP